MSGMSKAQVFDLLHDFHPRIRGVVDRAWDEQRTLVRLRSDAGLSATLYRRTISNEVFDAIARHAIGEFAGDPQVSLRIESQTIKLFFRGLVLARFKRGDRLTKLGRNVPTQAALAFVDADGMLPGMPPETAKVEFVWLTNDIQTALEHVLVVARDGNRLTWEYEIERDAGGASGTIIPFPARGPDDDFDDDMVRPKLPAAPKQEEE